MEANYSVVQKQVSKKSSGKMARGALSIFLVLAIIACLFVGESMAGKGKGEDIILYNGNIVIRGGGKKGKGGSIVVANSNQGGGGQMFDSWGGFRR